MYYSIYADRNDRRVTLHRSDCPNYKQNGGVSEIPNPDTFWVEGFRLKGGAEQIMEYLFGDWRLVHCGECGQSTPIFETWSDLE